MAHVLSCKCGQHLRVPTHLLGGQAKCSTCGTVIEVPRNLQNGGERSVNSSTVPQQIKFSCPYCDKRLTANVRSAGKLVTCPGCEENVVVPKRSHVRETVKGLPSNDISELLDEVEQERANEQPVKETCPHCAAPVAASDDRCSDCRRRLPSSRSPTRRRKLNQAAQIAVGWGISLVYFGLILSLSTIVLGVIGVAIRNDAMIRASLFVQLLVIPMGLAGKALCIAAPARYGQRFAVLATITEIVALVMGFNPPFEGTIHGFNPMPLLANFASLVSYFLFLSFLIALSNGMKQSGAAAAARAVADRTVQLIFLPPFLFALVGVLGTVTSFFGPYLILILAGIATLCVLALAVLWVVAYLQLLSFLKVRLLT